MGRRSKRSFRKEQELARWRFARDRRSNLLAKPGPHDFIVVLDHLKAGFNIAKIFRSADALGAKQVHVIGTGCFDPGPSKGSFKWVPAVFHDSFDSCYTALQDWGYTVFALMPGQDSDLTQSELPRLSAFVLGHEEYGLSFSPADYPEIRPLHIPQWGKVQSLNVSIAASIVMYEYVRQWNDGTPNKLALS